MKTADARLSKSARASLGLLLTLMNVQGVTIRSSVASAAEPLRNDPLLHLTADASERRHSADVSGPLPLAVGTHRRHVDPPARSRADIDRKKMTDTIGAMAVGFVHNVGQSSPEVRFHGAAPGAGFYATDAGMTVALRQGDETEVLSLRFAGAPNPQPHIRPSQPLAGVVNVLSGPQPHTGLARFGTLTYEQVWPGIDARFHTEDGTLKYEFLVAAGADPSRIHLTWEGAERLEITENGSLSLLTETGTLTDRAPVSYQEETKVSSHYVLEGRSGFRIAVGAYDAVRPLLIDPGLVYWSFLGGSGDEFGFGVAVDPAGAAYATGYTASPDFPSVDKPKTAPGHDQTHNGFNDVFVVKFDSTGQTLAYWTFLGGRDDDVGYAIAVDSLGAAYATGYTLSPDFPGTDNLTTAPGYDQTHNGLLDTFVVKLDPTGQTLVYWTFLGGSSYDPGFGITVDPVGAAHVIGYADSQDFPSIDKSRTAPGYDQTHNGSSDAFVVKLDATGQSLVYWTFLGGNSTDIGFAVAVDPSGAAYANGYTLSPDFPSTEQPNSAPGYDQTHNGGFDAFVVKLDPTGQTLVHWSFLGGGSDDLALSIALDASGAAYATGYTSSPDFPSTDNLATAPGYDQTHNGRLDTFVVKVDPTGQTLAYWTFVGGSADDAGFGIDVDTVGAAYVIGYTDSQDFPSIDESPTAPGYDQTHNGGSDAFVIKLDTTGQTLVYWTFLGGSSDDIGNGIAVDPLGAIYAIGYTLSPDFPSTGAPNTAPGYDQTHDGAYEGFVVKILPAAVPATLTLEPASAKNPVKTRHCVTATVHDAFDNPAPGVPVRFQVTGTVNTSGSATTDTNGRARFCYMGASRPGRDTIRAYVDMDADGVQDPGEPAGTATKFWVERPGHGDDDDDHDGKRDHKADDGKRDRRGDDGKWDRKDDDGKRDRHDHDDDKRPRRR